MLALVRFGLRAADDPRIINTVTAIDAVLKRELPAGPYWYRYNDDGYGEHANGAPSTAAASGGCGRCSPANERIMNWLWDDTMRRSGYSAR